MIMAIIETKRNNSSKPILLGGDPIVESYKLEELLAAKAQGQRICDYLRNIVTEEDHAELRRWKAWFRFKYTFRGYTKETNAYAITKGRKLRLWKIWEGD